MKTPPLFRHATTTARPTPAPRPGPPGPHPAPQPPSPAPSPGPMAVGWLGGWWLGWGLVETGSSGGATPSVRVPPSGGKRSTPIASLSASSLRSSAHDAHHPVGPAIAPTSCVMLIVIGYSLSLMVRRCSPTRSATLLPSSGCSHHDAPHFVAGYP